MSLGDDVGTALAIIPPMSNPAQLLVGSRDVMKKRIVHRPTMRRQSTFRHSLSTAKDVVTMTPKAHVVGNISQRTQKLIDDVRASFSDYASDFGSLVMSRAELAPKFMQAFRAFQKDTEQTFVAFVQVLDDTVPSDRDGYRKHSTYQAAENLRSLNAAQSQAAAKPIPAHRRPATPLVALAKMVATIVPLLDDTGVIWQAFLKQLHWSEVQVKRLQTLVVAEHSLLALPSQRTGTRG